MKKLLLPVLLVAGFGSLTAQKAQQIEAKTKPFLHNNATRSIFYDDPSRNINCVDTLNYSMLKKIDILGGDPLMVNYFSFWTGDSEKFTTTFKNPGTETISVRGVRFLSAIDIESTPSTVSVEASVWAVDANNVPTTQIGTAASVPVTGANFVYYAVTFPTPISVTGNYAIQLKPTTATGVVDFALTASPLSNTLAVENLSKFYSDFYGIFWETVEGSDTTEWEFQVEPIVSYAVNTAFTYAPATVCQNQQVAFTNTTTPLSILKNRQYNYGAFRAYFGLTPSDSLFAWDLSQIQPLVLSNLSWTQDATYTYATSGSKEVDLYTLGGFKASCLDIASQTITVNPSTNATFSYASNTICTGSPNATATTSSAGTFTSTPAGLVFANATTGEINVAGSTEGTYTVTYTTSGACSSTSTQTVTITSAPDASFSYANAAYCAGGTNPSPVLGVGASAGQFSSTSGLSINASTGVINLSTSTAGTYTVTNNIAVSGSCPAASETFDVTINAQPTATISGGGSICAGSGNSVPVSVALTGTGPWSIVVSNGIGNQTVPVTTSPATISVNEALAGTYTVVTVTDVLCSNSGTGSVVVSVTPTPTVNTVANQNLCNGAASTVVAFAGPVVGSTFAWSNSNTAIGLGASGNGNIASFTPTNTTGAAITATITVTPTANGCVGTPSTFTITVNPSPAVTFTAPGTVCVYNSSFALTPGTPAGGTFSGTGVSGSNFNPATAGLGTHTVTYSVTVAGCPGSETADIVVSACASIEDIIANDGLAIYPNPSTGNVTFEFANGSDVNLSIVSTEGKTVYQNNFQTTQATVDLSSLAKGTYFVRVTMNGKTSTSKLVLNK